MLRVRPNDGSQWIRAWLACLHGKDLLLNIIMVQLKYEILVLEGPHLGGKRVTRRPGLPRIEIRPVEMAPGFLDRETNYLTTWRLVLIVRTSL